MTIAVIADIHANLHALEAVLKDARQRGAERFLCLGDIVGYGAQPEECVQLIRSIDAATVLGNHDAWALRPEALAVFAVSSPVTPGLEHSRLRLSTASKRWLQHRPYTVQEWSVAGVHGGFYRPEKWPYLDSAGAARASFQRQPTTVAFFGHTHEPGYWQEGGDRLIKPTPNYALRLGTNRRYALNPGSVGNPRTPSREADPRAQYLLFDSDNFSVSFIRVAYDMRACITAMREAGLPEEMMSRVESGY